MSVVGERERRLILDLLLKRISEDEFYRSYPLARGEASHAGQVMLARALKERDAAGAEFGLYLGARFGITDEYLDVLLELATAPWHERHEDIVDALAILKSPKSVDTLVRAATTSYPYRDYDQFNSLGVKCVYALAKIGTPEAVAGLRKLKNSGDPNVAREAGRHLRRIDGIADEEDDDE